MLASIKQFATISAHQNNSASKNRKVQMEKLILEIKQFCKDNYENGYDSCIECWGDSDYSEWINDFSISSLDGFIESYKFVIDRKLEIASTAF